MKTFYCRLYFWGCAKFRTVTMKTEVIHFRSSSYLIRVFPGMAWLGSDDCWPQPKYCQWMLSSVDVVGNWISSIGDFYNTCQEDLIFHQVVIWFWCQMWAWNHPCLLWSFWHQPVCSRIGFLSSLALRTTLCTYVFCFSFVRLFWCSKLSSISFRIHLSTHFENPFWRFIFVSCL